MKDKIQNLFSHQLLQNRCLLCLFSLFLQTAALDNERHYFQIQPKKGQDLVIAFASANFALVSRIFLKCFSRGSF